MRELVWVGSSLDDYKEFHETIQDDMGYALYLAQEGEKPPQAKPLKGFGGAGVLEVVADDAGGTYRAVYTVRLKTAVYVLHVFQKKSRRSIATPEEHIERVRVRLRLAEQIDTARTRTVEEEGKVDG